MASSSWMNHNGVTSGLPSARTTAMRISTPGSARKAARSAVVRRGMAIGTAAKARLYRHGGAALQAILSRFQQALQFLVFRAGQRPGPAQIQTEHEGDRWDNGVQHREPMERSGVVNCAFTGVIADPRQRN